MYPLFRIDQSARSDTFAIAPRSRPSSTRLPTALPQIRRSSQEPPVGLSDNNHLPSDFCTLVNSPGCRVQPSRSAASR
jgi:hypothetical protein